MRSFRPGILLRWLFPDALFREKSGEKVLCLTFDDGPDRISTPAILDILGSHNIKALFFCTGRAASENRSLIDKIREEGHIIGNHGFDHLNGFFTSNRKYLEDIANASQYTSAVLFRPPYGKIRFSQYGKLRKQFRIILWDVMPYDFDLIFGEYSSLEVLKKKIRPGSVIVLHDTSRSFGPVILERFLEYSLDKGYRFILPSYGSGKE